MEAERGRERGEGQRDTGGRERGEGERGGTEREGESGDAGKGGRKSGEVESRDAGGESGEEGAEGEGRERNEGGETSQYSFSNLQPASPATGTKPRPNSSSLHHSYLNQVNCNHTPTERVTANGGYASNTG